MDDKVKKSIILRTVYVVLVFASLPYVSPLKTKHHLAFIILGRASFHFIQQIRLPFNAWCPLKGHTCVTFSWTLDTKGLILEH